MPPRTCAANCPSQVLRTSSPLRASAWGEPSRGEASPDASADLRRNLRSDQGSLPAMGSPIFLNFLKIRQFQFKSDKKWSILLRTGQRGGENVRLSELKQ